jgi:hypothetical protein
VTNTTSPLPPPSTGGSGTVETSPSPAVLRTVEAVSGTRHARTRSRPQRNIRVDWRGSGMSATDKLKKAATDAVGPAYVVASVVGAIALAVGGSIAVVADLLKERRYQAHPEH